MHCIVLEMVLWRWIILTYNVSEIEDFFRKHGIEGEPVLEEETGGRRRDMDFVVQRYKKVPVNFGLEMEQDGDDTGFQIPQRDGATRVGYEYERDWASAHAPMETQLPSGEVGHDYTSMRYPGRFILRYNRRYDRKEEHHWMGERLRDRDQGFGSHMHYSPRIEDYHEVYFPYPIAERPDQAWCVTWNTSIDLQPFYMPMLAWGGYRDKFYHRQSIGDWATPITRRLSNRTMRREYLDRPFNFTEHKGHNLTMHPKKKDRETGKIVKDSITIELRGNEAHPSVSYYTMLVLNRIIRKCIEENGDGWVSPKLDVESCALVNIPELGYDDREVTRKELIGEVLKDIMYKSHELVVDGPYNDLYEIYSGITKILFESGRGIPLVGEEFDTWDEVFDGIIRKYTPVFPPVGRIGVFFRNRGNPHDEWNRFWYTYLEFGEFDWGNIYPEYEEPSR